MGQNASSDTDVDIDVSLDNLSSTDLGQTQDELNRKLKQASSDTQFVQKVTRLNTRRNSEYKNCVIELSQQPRPIGQQLIQELTTVDKAEHETLGNPQMMDIIPEHSYEDEPCSGDPIPYRDADGFEEVEFQSSHASLLSAGSESDRNSQIPVSEAQTSTVGPNKSRQRQNSSNSLKWHRRVSVARFDNRNAPIALGQALQELASKQYRSLPRSSLVDVPLPLRRFSVASTGHAKSTTNRSILKSSSKSELVKIPSKIRIQVSRLPTEQELQKTIEEAISASSQPVTQPETQPTTIQSTPSKRKRFITDTTELNVPTSNALPDPKRQTPPTIRRKRTKSVNSITDFSPIKV